MRKTLKKKNTEMLPETSFSLACACIISNCSCVCVSKEDGTTAPAADKREKDFSYTTYAIYHGIS